MQGAALLGGPKVWWWPRVHPCSPVLQLACTLSLLGFLHFQNDYAKVGWQIIIFPLLIIITVMINKQDNNK